MILSIIDDIFIIPKMRTVVTEDTDVEELLDLVISVGRSVQENSRVLDTMSEIVKKVNIQNRTRMTTGVK